MDRLKDEVEYRKSQGLKQLSKEQVCVKAESYVCFLHNGTAEYGYTFKRNSEDSEFDIKLGVSRSPSAIDAHLLAFKETAEKIAMALK